MGKMLVGPGARSKLSPAQEEDPPGPLDEGLRNAPNAVE